MDCSTVKSILMIRNFIKENDVCEDPFYLSHIPPHEELTQLFKTANMLLSDATLAAASLKNGTSDYSAKSAELMERICEITDNFYTPLQDLIERFYSEEMQDLRKRIKKYSSKKGYTEQDYTFSSPLFLQRAIQTARNTAGVLFNAASDQRKTLQKLFGLESHWPIDDKESYHAAFDEYTEANDYLLLLMRVYSLTTSGIYAEVDGDE